MTEPEQILKKKILVGISVGIPVKISQGIVEGIVRKITEGISVGFKKKFFGAVPEKLHILKEPLKIFMKE